MKPSAFEYYRPSTVEETLGLLAEHGEDARLLAGGQSLVPLMNLRMASPPVLVDLNRVRDLAYVREDGDALAIGAMTRYADVETSALVRRHFPMLVEATAEVGYVGIRTRGTVGGAIAHADPVAEWPCLALALDAEMVAAGPEGRRTITADDFFLGMFETALAPGEMLVEIRFPLRPDSAAWAFREFARKTGDYAVVAVAAELGVADGVITRARVAFSNLADRPVRPAALEAALEGLPARPAPDATLLASVPDLLRDTRPGDDETGRRALAAVLATRALADAFARLPGGTP